MRIAVPAVLASALCAPPALAGNNEVSIGGTSRSLRTASANAVTTENLGGVQLGVARRLPLDVVPNLQLWATGGFASTSAVGELFGMLTEIDAIDLTLGGTARYELHPNLAFVGHIDLGPSRTSLAIEGNSKRVTDTAWGANATGALGVDLFLVANRRFSLGARLELGYTTHAPAALAPKEASSEDMLVLSESQASIGHLDLGGRFYTFSLLSQF